MQARKQAIKQRKQKPHELNLCPHHTRTLASTSLERVHLPTAMDAQFPNFTAMKLRLQLRHYECLDHSDEEPRVWEVGSRVGGLGLP
jgi:hypothetical protein